jgi:hypothetical protein
MPEAKHHAKQQALHDELRDGEVVGVLRPSAHLDPRSRSDPFGAFTEGDDAGKTENYTSRARNRPAVGLSAGRGTHRAAAEYFRGALLNIIGHLSRIAAHVESQVTFFLREVLAR